MDHFSDKILMFRNRLAKVYKHISKQANRQGITCYRVYDHDLPEFPFIIEVYGDKLYVAEYKRRHNMTDEEHDEWLEQCKAVMADVLPVLESNIFIKVRQRKAGRLGQYQKLEETKTEFVVEEQGLQFIINLSDYLDTGLFLDHRITRQMVKDMCEGKKVLNLFCYTGSFSVYAAAGGAAEVTSIDLSNTYLAWAVKNMELNFPQYTEHHSIQADVKKVLKTLTPASYDIIVMDPPTFSNSKRMDDFLDIQRDHVALINDCMVLLKEGGVLFFSTNFTRFNLMIGALKASDIKDITKATTPFDFGQKLNRFCFKISK